MLIQLLNKYMNKFNIYYNESQQLSTMLKKQLRLILQRDTMLARMCCRHVSVCVCLSIPSVHHSLVLYQNG